MCLCPCIIFACVDSDKDDFDQVRAVKALCAIFTVLVKDKEKIPYITGWKIMKCVTVDVTHRWLKYLKFVVQRHQKEILHGLGGL